MGTERRTGVWRRARAGDPTAYDRLFARHTDRTLMFIRARLGRRLRAAAESRDVLHDAYLAAHRDFASFDCTDDAR